MSNGAGGFQFSFMLALILVWASFGGLFQVPPCLSHTREARAGHSTPDVVLWVLSKGKDHLLDLLVTLFLVQPRIMLVKSLTFALADPSQPYSRCDYEGMECIQP